MYEAWHLIAESFNKFPDSADPKLLARIVEIIGSSLARLTKFMVCAAAPTAVRCTSICTLVVPAQWTVTQAHEELERLELASAE